MPSKSLNKKGRGTHNSSTSFEEKLKYAIDNGDATIDKTTVGKRKGLRNVVTIGERNYRYNPNKITKTLTSKLNKRTKTDKIEGTHETKRIYKSIRLRNSLKSCVIKTKSNYNTRKKCFWRIFKCLLNIKY